MKRLSYGLILIALVTGISLFVSTGNGLAIRPDSEGPSSVDCSEYNGKTLIKSGQKFKDYKASGCRQSDGGTCTGEAVKKDGKDAVKITCTATTESGGGDGEGEGGGDDTSTAATGETYKDDALSTATCTTDNCDLITNYINPVIKLMSVMVGLAVAIGIIFGAIQVASSEGDPQKAANGRGHIRNALIGAVAYIVLFAFLQFIVPGGIV